VRSLLASGTILAGLVAIAACSAGTGNTTPPVAAPLGGYTQAQSDALDAVDGTSNFVLPPNVVRACPVNVEPGRARCFAQVRTDIGGGPDVNGYTPADLEAAYNLPSTTQGSGQTIAIVDAYDDPNAESDLATYRSTFGLPACGSSNGCFQKLNQDGLPSPLPSTPPASQGSWTVELSLDVDMVSASCPNCHIMLMEANDNFFGNLSSAVDHAVKLGANVVSNSYGAPTKQLLKHVGQQYNHPGHIILASAGDSGYGAAVPASFPWVVSVGGTTLQKSSGSRGWTETAWGGTGAGCAPRQTQASWQHNLGTCRGRAENDISADASPATGVAVYDTYHAGGFIVVGGTSVASPLLGGVYGLAGNASTLNAAQSLYKKGASLYDVTTGSDGTCMKKLLCTAGPGWDGPTGNGTPNGATAF